MCNRCKFISLSTLLSWPQDCCWRLAKHSAPIRTKFNRAKGPQECGRGKEDKYGMVVAPNKHRCFSKRPGPPAEPGSESCLEEGLRVRRAGLGDWIEGRRWWQSWGSIGRVGGVGSEEEKLFHFASLCLLYTNRALFNEEGRLLSLVLQAHLCCLPRISTLFQSPSKGSQSYKQLSYFLRSRANSY